jgi:2-phospho-L-lactate guanylyltransferase
MLEKTFVTLSHVPEIQHTMVVSRDSAILTMADEFGFKGLQENEDASDLNIALKQAAVAAQMHGATSLLIFPADLPLLKPETIQDILEQADHIPGMVIAPDRHLAGTNALWISPPDLIEFRFGPRSFSEHVKQAQTRNVVVKVIKVPELGIDLDVPDDLVLVSRNDPSFSFLRSHS